MEEAWKDVKGYEGYYQVSSLGRVRSLDRVVSRCLYMVHVAGRIMDQRANTNGYMRVALSRNGVCKYEFVHRLVATAFVENPNSYGYVDHIDSDRLNNCASNLAWCTQGDNIHFAYERGRRPHVHLSQEAIESLSAANRRQVIRDDGKVYKSVGDAADDIGVTGAMVSHVLNGRAKTAHGHSFAYV